MVGRTLDEAALPELERRLRGLRADTPGRWGGMDAPAMVCHLRATIEVSLGELQAPRLVPDWLGAPIGFLITTVFTRWPRGRKGARTPIPALCPTPRAPFDDERERLIRTMRRFVERLNADPQARARHPLMGPATRRRWARLHALHLAHHLRQFGA
jgi:oxepin-CoA hydrolase/3-oxo-5,6-dehydrosuberyl-CoA semialdehyde dehydrogenase